MDNQYITRGINYAIPTNFWKTYTNKSKKQQPILSKIDFSSLM